MASTWYEEVTARLERIERAVTTGKLVEPPRVLPCIQCDRHVTPDEVVACKAIPRCHMAALPVSRWRR